jgi:hypothetical protein
MGEAYSAIRAMGIIATVFSIYRGLTSAIPLDDLIAILGIALAMIWLGNDLEKRKAKSKRSEPVFSEAEASNIDIGKILGIGGPSPG